MTCLLFILFIPSVKGDIGILRQLLLDNAISIPKIIYHAWCEGSKQAVSALELTVANADDIAVALSYANVKHKAGKYRSAVFRLTYADDMLSSAELNKNIAYKKFNEVKNTESTENSVYEFARQQYKGTLYLYEKAFYRRNKELIAVEYAKTEFDKAIEYFRQLLLPMTGNI